MDIKTAKTEQLKARLLLIKLEVNSTYGININYDIDKATKAYVSIRAIKDELRIRGEL